MQHKKLQEELENKNRDGLVVSRRDFIAVGSGAILASALPLGCGGDESSGGAGAADPAASGTPWAGSRKLVDLLDKLHLADLDHFGEFVDFGTAARFKYSLGGWMSGWASDTSINGVDFTWATKSPSRIYFSLPQQTGLTFRMRVKKGGIDVFSVYLNDKPLSRVMLKGGDWLEYQVTASAEVTKSGENYLKFIYKTSEKKVGGVPASFSVDYLRIIPDGVDPDGGGTFAPPYLSRLRTQFDAAGKSRDSLMMALPSTLSYYLEVPEDGKLCFHSAVTGKGEAASADLKVTVTPADGGASTDVLSKTISGAVWHDEMVDLSGFAGKLVKLTLATAGTAGNRLAIANPTIRIQAPRIEHAGKKIKNAIVLLIDTLRADKLAAYAKTHVQTPAFNKFVQESVLFSQCQAPSNWTKPSCATVLTGLYPDSHKARGHASKMAKSIKMASEIYREAGYQTGAFIANGYLAKEFGFNRSWTQYTNFIRENKKTEAEHVLKTSLDFISNAKDKPFFAYIQTIDPHVPYDPPGEDLRLYDPRQYEGPVSPRSTGNLLEEFKRKKVALNARDRRRLEALYDGEITYHDRYFGHFLDGLNKLGVLDETVIVVCSDHGEEFFDHESVGHGHTLHQELLHVPLVVRAPGVFPAGKTNRADVGLADILPTIMASNGLPLPPYIEGRNLLPEALGSATDPMNAAFSSFFSEADDRNLSWTVRKGDFKLRMKGPARTYLYNLASDPAETTDVDERYPVALRALRVAMGQFIGAPNKGDWISSEVASQAVGRPEAAEEKTDVPDDLKAQLRALGYMQ